MIHACESWLLAYSLLDLILSISYSKRLFALASQKFISDIANDAYQYARIRTTAGPGGRGRPTGTSKVRYSLLSGE